MAQAYRSSRLCRSPARATTHHRRDAAHQRLFDLLRADEMDVGIDRPAVTIMPSRAMISVPGPTTTVIPGWTSGLPALPIAATRPLLIAMSALTMSQ